MTHPSTGASSGRWPLRIVLLLEATVVGVLLALSWHNYRPLWPTLSVALVLSALGFGVRLWTLGWGGIPTSFAASAGLFVLCAWPVIASSFVTTGGDKLIRACHDAGVTGMGEVFRWALPAGEYCTDQYSGQTFLDTPASTLTAVYCLLGISAIARIAAHLHLRRFPAIASLSPGLQREQHT